MAGSSSGAPDSVRSVLTKLEESLEFAYSQLLGDIPSGENPAFDLDAFWNDFTSAAKLVSHEATKFCLAFDGKETLSPQECQSLTDKTEKACLTFLAIFFSLPKSKGFMLHTKVRQSVLRVLNGMKKLCTTAKNHRNSNLQNVGDVWECCTAVENLPRDNRIAVLNFYQEQVELLQDACDELTEALQPEAQDRDSEDDRLSERDVEERWTASEKNVVFPASGLIRAYRVSMKKTREAILEAGDASDDGKIAELDKVADIVSCCTELTDDLVMMLYPPMNHSEVREQALFIRDNCKFLLSKVKTSHFCPTAEDNWVKFLEKAVDHNWSLLNDLVLAD